MEALRCDVSGVLDDVLFLHVHVAHLAVSYKCLVHLAHGPWRAGANVPSIFTTLLYFVLVRDNFCVHTAKCQPRFCLEEVRLAQPEDEKRNESQGTIHYSTRNSRGELLGGGVSGLVELQPDGNAIKSPWTGWEEADSRRDLLLEIRAYRRLFECFGVHERFLTPISCDESECTITMEYMVNGTLRHFLHAPGIEINAVQRHEWILALAEGMQMMHTANIVHCDFSPRNVLLDQKLSLEIADFGCCSMDASLSTGCGSVRFYPPHTPYRFPVAPEFDIFALGSSLYEVVVGMPPFHDLATKQVRSLYALQQFPDLIGVEFADIIRDCWLFKAGSARDVHGRLFAAIFA
ncbi:hypothetical protein LTR01_004152 [Friedmanniomyces endolithicus]|nr:hypothetical protein LTR01_004152 [Friedmanniomyces endolithicus]KAK0826495.1 hypothetical protein LTR73_006360 [Friedmanniomyces endolithicus]